MAISKKKIHITPIGNMDMEVLEELSKNIREIIDVDVMILPPIEEPEHAYNPSRNQFHSTEILSKLRKSVFQESRGKEDVFRVLGVADLDLYVPGLNFLFGEADLLGRAAIISLKRLRQEFYSLRPDKKLFLERVIKEAVHQLGHTLGLGHCINRSCVMHFSNKIEDTDRKEKDFCQRCQQHIGGAVAQRERI